MMMLLFSFYGYFYFGIVLRNAWALIFVYIGFYYLLTVQNVPKRLLAFYLSLSIAFLFHRSVIFFIFVPLLDRDYEDYVYWIWFPLILLMFGVNSFAFGWLTSLLAGFEGFGKILSYAESLRKQSSVSLIFLETYMLAVLLFLFKRNIFKNGRKYYTFYLNVLLLGLTVYSVSSKLVGVSRLAQSFFFFTFVPVYMVIYQNRGLRTKEAKVALMLIFSFVNFALLYYCHNYLFDGYVLK